MTPIFKQFRNYRRLSIEERREMLQAMKHYSVFPPVLSNEIADQMIENFTCNYQLPLGIAGDFVINDKDYLVPMVTEEPSVIAAAQAGARRIGNIVVSLDRKELIGQVVLSDVESLRDALEIINTHEDELLELAKNFSPSMVKRGGGPVKIWADTKHDSIGDFLVVYVSFDAQDAMGANALNTILEGISPRIQQLVQGSSLMSILSNYTEESVVKGRVEIPLIQLHRNQKRALGIARQIEKASRFSCLDVYRATTHNKGIMNGIDAVVVATGNDWRAVEAGAHAYASRSGNYQPLTLWQVSDDEKFLIGTIELPINVGTVGGTLAVHPVAQWSLELLGNPNSQELAEIIAAVGLAQNFSAVRALVTDGIQKGHMSLQARSLSLQAGATVEEVPRLVRRLRQEPQMNQESARRLLEEIRHEQ